MKQDLLDDVHGKYQMTIFFPRVVGTMQFQTEEIDNLIVDNGKTAFLNKLAEAVTSLAVGTGTTKPANNQTALVTERLRKAVTKALTSAPDWKQTFSANFSATEINGIIELGLTGATSILTRSLLVSAISIPEPSNLTIDYSLYFKGAYTAAGFTLSSGKTNTYQISEPVTVTGVTEVDTNNGYVKKTSSANVESTPASYYYDADADILYIHTSDNAAPENHVIRVSTGV